MMDRMMTRFASPRVRIKIFTFLAFLSGACALAYEVLYVRVLTTLLGDMLYVHAALLSTFLIGIGIGAKLAHRYVRWLYLFELLTGSYALALPIALSWLSGQTLIAEITASPMLTIISVVGLLSIPSLLIGFSIPLFSAYIKENSAKVLAFQPVYIAYNVGALFGLLLVELVMIKIVGISSSLAIIGIINIFNGLLLWGMRVGSKVELKGSTFSFPQRTVLALILVSFGSAVFQMFFLKLSYLVYQPYRENFAIGLAVTILGVSLGAWWASRTKVRFETILLLVPLVIGLTYLNYLPLLQVYASTAPWKTGSEVLVLLHKFISGCSFALGPMILFGATLPALLRSERDVASESGHLLFIASLANATGYLTYVLVGHPYFSTDAILAVIGGLALLGALLVIGRDWSKVQLGLAASAVLCLGLNMANWQERNLYLAQWADKISKRDEVTIYKNGADSATLLKTPSYEWVSYNGHPSIYISSNGKVNFPEVVSGVIPGINARGFENALVLGLGTGITAGTVAQIFKHTDVVEINKAFFQMLPRIRYANMDIIDNATAKIYFTDGRAFLVGKKNQYDVIVNSIPAPTYFSASKIYTVEFYERVKIALKPDGIFNTWLAVPNMTEEGVKVILSALRRSFRYCDLRLLKDSYFMATCSDQPLIPRSFNEVPVSVKLKNHLQEILPEFRMEEYFEDILVSNNIFHSYEAKVDRENTDDDPVLEFMLVRNYQISKMGNRIFSTQQDLLNIEPARIEELNDPDRFARRAGVFYLHNQRFFKMNFLSWFNVSGPYKDAWDLWLKKRDK